MMRRCVNVLILFAAFASSAMPVAARTRHHRRAAPPSAPAAPQQAAQPFMFYPNDIKGGVPGNLSFNNQIRKHTDPLNANGGR